MNRDDLTDLRRNTVIWIAVVLWLGVSYLLAIAPAGPYANALQTAFTVFLAVPRTRSGARFENASQLIARTLEVVVRLALERGCERDEEWLAERRSDEL